MDEYFEHEDSDNESDDVSSNADTVLYDGDGTDTEVASEDSDVDLEGFLSMDLQAQNMDWVSTILSRTHQLVFALPNRSTLSTESSNSLCMPVTTISLCRDRLVALRTPASLQGPSQLSRHQFPLL